jgi:hypothetical protein
VLDNARRFLEAVLPWPVGDEEGYCNIHFKSAMSDGRTIFPGRAFRTIDEAVKTLEYLITLKTDVYVCMSRQQTFAEEVTKGGHTWRRAKRSYLQAVGMKGLWIDIDVKAGAYETPAEAGKAFTEFASKLGLPQPRMIVRSGSGGLHVHWTFNEVLQRPEWQVLADALSAACKAHGLHFDSNCTVDSARLLRVPDTYNYKNPADPRPVVIAFERIETTLEALRAPLAAFVKAPLLLTGPGVFGLPRRAALTEGNELSAGIEDRGTLTVDIMDLSAACPAVEMALATGGAEHTQPLWMNMVGLMEFTTEPRQNAHAVSSGHAGYTAEATEAMYDRMVTGRRDKGLGWPRCDTFAKNGCKECATCPLLALNKSPLNHLKAKTNGAPSVTTTSPGLAALLTTKGKTEVLPSGYVRDTVTGLINKVATDENGNSIHLEVCPVPVFDAWLQDGPWVLNFKTALPHQGDREVVLPLSEIATKDGLVKVLASAGILLGKKHQDAMKEFTVSFVQRLQQEKHAVISSTPFGWARYQSGHIEGFVYANQEWYDDGNGNLTSKNATVPDPALGHQYMPKGKLDPWMGMSKIITDQKRPGLDAILASAFAAPLITFTGHDGCLLAVYSPESGIGKTTTMRTSQAVWGNPKRAMQGLDDTANSVVKKMGTLKELPIYWDELKTDDDTRRFVNLVFKLTGGKEKSRMDRGGGFQHMGDWKTLLVSASNDSLMDTVNRSSKSSTAGIVRMFEYALLPGTEGQIEAGVVQRLGADLEHNYGHVGLAYAQHLAMNHRTIASEVADLQDALEIELNAAKSERFWVATICTLVKGAEYANALGFTEIDVPAMKKFLVSVLVKMRNEVVEAPTDMQNEFAVKTILSQFLANKRKRNTLYTNKVWGGRGHIPPGTIVVNTDFNDPIKDLQELQVHIGVSDGICRINSNALSEYLKEKGHSRHAFTKALKEDFVMRDGAFCNLGGGTNFRLPGMRCIEIDFSGTDYRDHL